MYSGDEVYGEEVTSGYDPDTDPRFDEPSQNDEVLCCPDCERPNQFGELCPSCQRERDMDQGDEYEAADAAYDLQVEDSL